MKLTDEMINMAIENNQKFMIYDNNYVLLYKSFTVKDDKIDNYINNIKLLKEKGVNTPLILDYKLVNKGLYGYSKAVILEERAKGKSLEPFSNYLSIKQDDIDFKLVSNAYLKALDSYLDNLLERANAKEEFYDKFISDYLTIDKHQMQIDPKPLNFFFDKDKGFTFIDINGEGNNDLEYLPRYFLGVVLGYGLPNLQIHNTDVMYIDEDRLNKLKTNVEIIISKVITALEKHGYKKEDILKDTLNWTNQFKRLKLIDNIDNLSDKLQEDFNKIKLEEENKKQVSNDDWTIGW